LAAADYGDIDGLEPLRLPKMAELIAARLRRPIVRGELKEGDPLPSELELLERFDVSRPTLREAIRILESESLVSVRRGANGGARAQLPNPDVAARYAGFVLENRGTSLDDVYEARILLEPPIVGLLAARRTDEDIARLRAAIEEHDAVAHDPRRVIRAHAAFRALLMELAGNQTAAVLTGMIQHIIDLANWEQAEANRGTPPHIAATEQGLKAYRRVVDLIEDGSQAGAEEMWRKHLIEARAYVLRGDATTVLDLMG
jgi:DNA-binding FadR family transcriptional regulator